jgi:hypothetical protein
MSASIFAYTHSGFYPRYVSINRREGGVEIIVRSDPAADGTSGDTAACLLSDEVWAQLVAAASFVK